MTRRRGDAETRGRRDAGTRGRGGNLEEGKGSPTLVIPEIAPFVVAFGYAVTSRRDYPESSLKH